MLVFVPFAAAVHGEQSAGTSAASKAQAEVAARPEIEKKRQEAEQQAKSTLNQEAIEAIRETENAIKAIAEGKSDQAISAIERATGKINVLVARNPSTALIPVEAEVTVIDAAPTDVKAIREIAKMAQYAVEDRDYPRARVLLHGLASEIRVRTYNLPLGSYPASLSEAARLLDEKKPREASDTLLTALHTLAVIDRVTPLPLLIAQAAIENAQAESTRDKNAAQASLATAKAELERAKELGYAGNDPEYPALKQSVADLSKQLNGGEDTTSAFGKLKERIASFFKRFTR
jgi:hypothetical protein